MHTTHNTVTLDPDHINSELLKFTGVLICLQPLLQKNRANVLVLSLPV